MKISKDLQQRIKNVVSEKIDIVAYDKNWPKIFEEEKLFLESKFPRIIKRIEHLGSTAVPGLSAKPIVDMLIEVTNYKEVKQNIVPCLISLGYDYFWRPEFDKPPMYTWFIKRDKSGKRTHHLHMVIKPSKIWERLYFRDYLREFPKEAEKYGKLKEDLSEKFPNDRKAYTKAKTEYIVAVTETAKRYFRK